MAVIIKVSVGLDDLAHQTCKMSLVSHACLFLDLGNLLALILGCVVVLTLSAPPIFNYGGGNRQTDTHTDINTLTQPSLNAGPIENFFIKAI